MRKLRRDEDGKPAIVKTGRRKAKPKPRRTEDIRVAVPAPSYARTDKPITAWLAPDEPQEMAAAALRLFYERKVPKNAENVAEAAKALDGICAGIVERTRQREIMARQFAQKGK